MSICQAENGFSLDELVKKLAKAFENKAFSDILKMNLQLTQEVLMHRIFNNSSSQKCCPDGHLTLNGSFERRNRTSSGEFKMDFWRVCCSKCGKTFFHEKKPKHRLRYIFISLLVRRSLVRRRISFSKKAGYLLKGVSTASRLLLPCSGQ